MTTKAAGGGALNALKEKMQHFRDENEKLKDELEEKSAQLEFAHRTIDTVGVGSFPLYSLQVKVALLMCKL
jgi:predicted nuclease with TOPRIM domain